MDEDFCFMSRFSGLFRQILMPLAALLLFLGVCGSFTWCGSLLSQQQHINDDPFRKVVSERPGNQHKGGLPELMLE